MATNSLVLSFSDQSAFFDASYVPSGSDLFFYRKVVSPDGGKAMYNYDSPERRTDFTIENNTAGKSIIYQDEGAGIFEDYYSLTFSADSKYAYYVFCNEKISTARAT